MNIFRKDQRQAKIEIKTLVKGGEWFAFDTNELNTLQENIFEILDWHKVFFNRKELMRQLKPLVRANNTHRALKLIDVIPDYPLRIGWIGLIALVSVSWKPVVCGIAVWVVVMVTLYFYGLIG